jgi:acetylornithine deacetylase
VSAAESRRQQVLDLVDAQCEPMLALLQCLVRTPSTGGSQAEYSLQHVLEQELRALGLETDLWPIDLPALREAADFPGEEVERGEAWGLVGRLPGRGSGRSLMFNGHVDVVPPGDLAAWTTSDPYSGRARRPRRL